MITKLMSYEAGEMNAVETVQLFGDLIKSGMAWTLQGHYGRTARDLIESGLVNRDGSIDLEAIDV